MDQDSGGSPQMAFGGITLGTSKELCRNTILISYPQRFLKNSNVLEGRSSVNVGNNTVRIKKKLMAEASDSAHSIIES